MSDTQHPAFTGKSYDDFHRPAPRDVAREAARYREMLNSVVDFAYDNGYREHGVPLVGEFEVAVRAEVDAWWIAAIAGEAPFVVARIRKHVEAYAAARAPGRAEPTDDEVLGKVAQGMGAPGREPT